MKRANLFLLIVLLLLLSACGHVSSVYTASLLVVIEKDHVDEDYWIIAYDPNNQTEEEAFQIMVDNELLWNNIKVDEEYAASYTKEGNKPWVLEEIK
ncbi:hypothetical protein MHZ92_03390 [Sporosarcina sp. ACRSL]|nr:hypothetical protein [Sporosarcina sp. ACRSL]